MDKHAFLSTYNLTDDDLANAHISWAELEAIHNAYQEQELLLRDIGKEFIDEYLYDIETADPILTKRF